MSEQTKTALGILIAIIVVFAFRTCSKSDSNENVVGTYKVHKKEGYVTPSFNLKLNEDGSARVNVSGDDDFYGNWYDRSFEDYALLYLDENFEFVFGFDNPVLDFETNRLYVSYTAFEQKHPDKYFKVTKIK